MKNKMIELAFVVGFSLMAHQSFAAELTTQPLRSLDLKETQIKISSNLKYFFLGTETVLQHGQVVFNPENLEKDTPYCVLKGFGMNSFVDVLTSDLFVEILEMGGEYSDEKTPESGVFKTTMTLNVLQGTVTLTCQKPSPLKFNEVTLGEFVEVGGDLIAFENIGLNMIDEEKELGLTPALIFQPEKELQNVPHAILDAKLGATLKTDLSVLPSQEKVQAAWIFENGSLMSSAFKGLNQKRCALEMLSEQPTPLAKGFYLTAKSITGHYLKDISMPSKGLGAAGFETKVQLAADAGRAVLSCTSNGMQPLTYFQSQEILGENLAWSLMEDEAYPEN